ncbi:hypothetical protein [Paraburkholderia sp. WP4_3_2]|uniref:hypothetical protein n=1 Tax=Paraburkholderia sp. WP4_3_2 TaxID=2587162 RepID=UPI0016092326|nr:hypothetical protein [Paraburkholderia sp. WP4_3_2]MBB3256884.1 hypothetical protein [Paraburkholderia sp. WP4_3_2]
MTPAKYQAALSAQTGIARKVLDMVPIQDAWTRAEIAGAMKRVTKSTPDVAVLEGCLARLKDAGLIRERGAGQYQRVEVREKEVPIVSTVIVANPGPKLAEQSASPIDVLARLAERARSMATQIVVLASDIETAALTIEQGNAESAAEAAKLRQLKDLLKGIA